MSTKYISSNWRLLNQENSNKSDNYGLSFDGSSEYIEINPPSTNTINLDSNSFSFWVNYANSSGYGTAIRLNTASSSIWVYVGISGVVGVAYYLTGSSGLITNTALTQNTWHHIVCTFDGSTNVWKIYVDNVEVADKTQAVSIGLWNQTTNNVLGASTSAGAEKLTGQLSEVAIFDYALSSTQISTLYGSSSLGAGNPMALKPQPVAYYNLGDNTSGGLLPNPSPPPTNISILTQPNEAVEDASVFDFDGSSVINSNLSLDNSNGITLSLWMKAGTQSGLVFLCSNGNTGGTNSQFNFRFGQDGKLYQYLNGGFTGVALIEGLNNNEWNNIVITLNYSTGDIIGYKNTTQGPNTLTTGSSYTTVEIDCIGAATSSGTYGVVGEISNVQVWQTVLNTSEIETLYNSGVPLLTGTQPQASSLRAWYKLDQSANWEADSSGNWQIPDAVSAYPQSFDFDGSTNQITLPSDFIAANEFSISIWLKPDDVSNNNFLGDSSSSNNWFRLSSTTQIKLKIASTVLQFDESGGNNLTVSDWNHILIYRDASNNVGIFVNGQTFSSTQSNSLTLTLSTIGRATNIFYEGQMSNVALWNSDQSSEALNIYNSGVPTTSYTNIPTAWYKLDNTATFSTNWSIPDASGNGNTGTSSGMTEQNLVNNNVSVLNGESNGMTSANLVLSDLTRAVPYDSYSFNFDSASSDYIQLASSSTAIVDWTQPYSISLWVKYSTPLSWDLIATFGIETGSTSTTRYIMIGGNSGYLFTGVGDTDGGTTNIHFNIGSGLDQGDWHHLVYIGDGSAGDYPSVYIDGVLEPYSGGTTALYNSSTYLNVIGTGSDASGRYFPGKISNVSIFNKALTSTEVLKLYSNGVPQNLANFTPSPQAWWTLGSNSFWNGSAWVVRDMIGSNDGDGINLGQDALVGDSPRSSAGGTGTNMDIPTNLEGSTKWSSNNSWSINMSSTARVEDTP